jgi:hypothetical protein
MMSTPCSFTKRCKSFTVPFLPAASTNVFATVSLIKLVCVYFVVETKSTRHWLEWGCHLHHQLRFLCSLVSFSMPLSPSSCFPPFAFLLCQTSHVVVKGKMINYGEYNETNNSVCMDMPSVCCCCCRFQFCLARFLITMFCIFFTRTKEKC